MRLHVARIGMIVVVALGVGSCGEDDDQTTHPINSPPVIESIAVLPAVMAVGGTVGISVVANDVDGDELTYDYTPEGGVINGDSATATWDVPNVVGSYAVTVRVSDGSGGSAVAAGGVTVVDIPNEAPVITGVTVNPVCVLVGAPVSVSVVAEDPDGDPLTYWFQLGTTVRTTGETSNVTLAAPSSPGTFSLTASVEDGRGGTATNLIDLPVKGLPIVEGFSPLPNANVGTTFRDPDNAQTGWDNNLVLVGLRVWHGSRIDAVQPIYRILNGDLSLGGTVNGDRHGGPGGDPTSLTRNGYVVVAVIVYTDGWFLKSVQLVFSPWGDCGGITGGLTGRRTSDTIGDPSGERHILGPGIGPFGVGIHGSIQTTSAGNPYCVAGLGLVYGRLRE